MSKRTIIVVDDRPVQSWEVITELRETLAGDGVSLDFRQVAVDGTVVEAKEDSAVDFFSSEDISKVSDKAATGAYETSDDSGEVWIYIDLALTDEENARARREGNYDGQFVPLLASRVLQSLADKRGERRSTRAFVYTTVPQLMGEPELVKQRLLYWVHSSTIEDKDAVPVCSFPWSALKGNHIIGDDRKAYLDRPPLFWVKADNVLAEGTNNPPSRQEKLARV